jgi:hypothetical protein
MNMASRVTNHVVCDASVTSVSTRASEEESGEGPKPEEKMATGQELHYYYKLKLGWRSFYFQI